MTADSILLSKDIAARHDSLDVGRSFIVQAPAGSGKTELLIQRYLALLAVVECPEEVLAITFTRKAAEEMRVRVIDALRKSRDGIEPDTEHEKLTQTLANAVLTCDIRNDWQLIESPRRMRIDTVDAFSAGIARSLPLGSGLGGADTTIADAEILTIYREAAAATLDYLAVDSAAAGNVEQILVHLDNNVALYVAYLVQMLASREQWLDITGSGIRASADGDAARRQLEANITDVVQRHLAAVLSLLAPVAAKDLPHLLEYAAYNLEKEGKTEHRLAGFTNDGGLPAAKIVDQGRWLGIADLLLTRNGEWRKRVTKNDGFPVDNKEAKTELIEVITAMRNVPGLQTSLARCRLLPEPRYDDGQWEVLLALFELLPLAVAELRRIFGERGVTDHNEVAISAARALGSSDDPGEIAMMLDYHVQHLLVDEMQDTSIAQYDLLRKLTAGWSPNDGRTIFCVGDPMQSIYRFRDAEVGEFLIAREGGIGSVQLEALTLRQNFRSGENLVHWFNTVFSQIMPLRDDVRAGAISYTESTPTADKIGQGKCQVHPLFDAGPEQEAMVTLDVIRECLAADESDDVTVLVRSRAQVAALLPALRREQIEYQAVEIERLTDVPEIIELIALTRALCHEDDRLAWLALLRSPAVGMMWADIHALVREHGRQTVSELVKNHDKVATLSPDGQQRLALFFDRIAPFRHANRVRGLREQVELAWHAIGGPTLLVDDEQLENVYRYLETISRISEAGTLRDVRELEHRLDEERVTGSASSDCRLRVMTMHKAKGLQFDHVILPSLGRSVRGSRKAVLSWLNLPDSEGRNEMIISPVGPRAALENDPLHRFIEEIDKDKNRMELDRLLYVSCTRAKKTLHLVGSVRTVKEGESLSRPDTRSLLSRLWPVVESDYERGFRTHSHIVRENEWTDKVLFVEPELWRMTQDWNPPVNVSIPGPERSQPTATDEDKPVDYYWVGSAARHAGTIVHRWLHRISEKRLDIENLIPEQQTAITRRWATGLGVPPAELKGVCKRVEEALRGILGDPKGCWVLHGEGYAEMALSGIVDGHLESVVIDRVRVDADGTHWVIDYKTSTHEGSDLDGFLDQEADRYRAQLMRYTSLYSAFSGAPVKTALYFPLLQEFREVDCSARLGEK